MSNPSAASDEPQHSTITTNKVANKENKVKHLYDQIESIKKTICMANGDRPELWIQRQNLQDLYHQVILNDIDFTIDKKLEQDLWNYVFKSQINYFQAQIKENRPSSSLTNTNASTASKLLSSSSSQKRIEAQASLFFFLEAARGFYIKLLEDIVLIYDFNELVTNSNDNSKLTGSNFLLPFCQRFPSIFDKINSSNYSIKAEMGKDKKENASHPSKIAKEKQILYICQHILTHLGDIARYANLFEQAKNYYLHAIKLVPYLGHPYNQLGILFETSRTNQLSTIFYYVRSVACRYNFPLASTNMENFFKKLVDIPLSRYNPTLANSNLLNNNEPQTSTVVKLSHKDLISLFLQINAFIYYMSKETNSLPSANGGLNSQRIGSFMETFRSSFVDFISTPLQRDKLSSIQINQMITILIFLIAQTTTSSQKNEQSSASKTDKVNLKALANMHALNLFVFLVEKLIGLFSETDQEELTMSSLYIAFNYIEKYDSSCLISQNKLWTLNNADKKSDIFNSVSSTVSMLNKFHVQVADYKEDLVKFGDYPLAEDRMLDSFLPFRDIHANLNFSKYMRTRVQSMNAVGENVLRKRRILNCVRRALHEDNKKTCYVLSVIEKDAEEIAKEAFKLNREACHAPPGEILKTQNENKQSEPMTTSTEAKATGDLTSQPQQPAQQQRKRRQIVAINSLTQQQQQKQQQIDSKTNLDMDAKSKQNIINMQPMMLHQQQQQMMVNNQMNFNNAASNNLRNPMMNNPALFGPNLMNNNPPLLNDPPPMFPSSMSKPNNLMLNNSLLNQSLMRQQQMPQQQQQLPSFFPSASQRQFQQPDMFRSNFNQMTSMNFPRPNTNENFSNFQSDMGMRNIGMGMRTEMASNMMGNANFNMQMNNQLQSNFNNNNQLNKMLSMNGPNPNSALLANPQITPFNMSAEQPSNSSMFFQNQQQMFMQQKMPSTSFNNQQIPMRHHQQNSQQDNQSFNFANFQNQQKQGVRDNMRLVAPHQFLESNNNKMASYFDQTNNPTGESFNDNPINNKSDLIDRLASSKSFNYIWTNDSESSKNKTSTSNSLPVDTLIQNNSLRMNAMFNPVTSESDSNSTNNGILTNILQQLNTNLFPAQSSGTSKQPAADNVNRVDLATMSLPTKPSDVIVDSAKQTNAPSIWSFPEQKKQQPK